MTDPLVLLVVVFGLIGVSALVFWPGGGLAWRWRRSAAATDRVEIEDALKHVWDGEYRQRPASLESLAGALGLASEESQAILMEVHGDLFGDSEGDA